MSNWRKLEHAVNFLEIIGENTDDTGGLAVVADVTKLGGNNIAVNSGVLSTGVQRVAIATDDVNLAAINTSAASIDTSANNIESSCASIATSTGNIDTSANNIEASCATIATNTGNTNTNIERFIFENAANDSVRIVQTAMPLGTAQWLTFNSGNLDVGTQRVAIATNDVNLAAINSNIAAMKTKIDSIEAILVDVWDDAANSLRTI